MSKQVMKACDLFADLAEKQKVLLAQMPKTTLEEAREVIKWLKDGKADKKLRS